MIQGNSRFVKSSPDLMQTQLWENDALFKLYHFLLYRLNHADTVWQGIVLHANEVLISRQTASEQLHWSIHKYQRHLKALQELNVVAIRSSGKGTIITVMQFDTFTECSQRIHDVQGRQNAANAEAIAAPMKGCHSPSTEAGAAPKRGCRSPEIGATATPVIEEYKDRETLSSGARLYSSEPEGFEQLWLAYPIERRTRRAEAAEIFRAALVQGATVQAILDSLEEAKRSFNWRKENGRYIPSLVTWLHKETWRDCITPKESEDSEEWTTSW